MGDLPHKKDFESYFWNKELINMIIHVFWVLYLRTDDFLMKI